MRSRNLPILVMGLLCSSCATSLSSQTRLESVEAGVDSEEAKIRRIQAIDTVEGFDQECADMLSDPLKFEECRRKLTVFMPFYLWLDTKHLLKDGESLKADHLNILYGLSGREGEVMRRTLAAVIASKCRGGKPPDKAATFEELLGPECRESLPTLAQLGLEIDPTWAGIPAVSSDYEKIAPSDSPTPFHFRVKFLSPEHKGQTLNLAKGALLQPVDQRHPDLLYQPVTLCSDIGLQFGEDGRSQWVELEGFCYGPGLPVPPNGATWVLSGVSAEDVTDLDIDDCLRQSVRKEIRKRQTDATPPPRSPTENTPPDDKGYFKSVCTRSSRKECVHEFEDLVSRWYPGRRLSDLQAAHECDMSRDPQEGQKFYSLTCKQIEENQGE